MFFPDGAPISPPLSPPPLSTPAGVERGAQIGCFVSDEASTACEVAPAVGTSRPRANSRRERHTLCTPRLAAAPASGETEGTDRTRLVSCLAYGRPHCGRRRWHISNAPLTTTVSQKSCRANPGGDGSLRSSLSRTPTTKSRLPSLPPAGGREGRGDEWGVVQRLARANLKTTKQKSPEGKMGRH